MSQQPFHYSTAFGRNLGWLTEWEQHLLRHKRVAVAGMGGVGGQHLLTLARLGIGEFHIADLDSFELANFNRQAGAAMSTLGQPKVDVMAAMARDINPDSRIRVFSDGVTSDNCDAFLGGVDLFIDGFDFFVLDIRAQVFARCAELGIPALTAAPIGMGVAYLNFLPGGMTFERYFRLQGQPLLHQYVNFLVGLSPRAPHRRYLADPNWVDLSRQRAPSTSMACQLCAGVIVTEALKILLRRGTVHGAPIFQQYDAYSGRFYRGRLPFGNRGPLQTVRRRLGYRMAQTLALASRNDDSGSDSASTSRAGGAGTRRTAPDGAGAASAAPPGVRRQAPSERLTEILQLARWSPSGDNAQPWRFQRLGPRQVLIHIAEQSASNVYEFNAGQPTLLSAGCLLETMALAALRCGWRLDWRYAGCRRDSYRLQVDFPDLANDVATDADDRTLSDFITVRSVDRRVYRHTPLSTAQKESLRASLGGVLDVEWHETAADRLAVARINALATDIRLGIPEAYPVHRQMLDWSSDFSTTGIPAQAVGLDPMTGRLMRWVMGSWGRVQFMNRYLGGTLTPRLQLDLLPGLRCAAQFSLSGSRPVATVATATERPPEDVVHLLEAGRAFQRFWLTATRLGLALQPGLAPLCFGFYGRERIAFTENARLRRKAQRLDRRLSGWSESYRDGTLLLAGRVGVPLPRSRPSRSHRRRLDELWVPEAGESDDGIDAVSTG